MTRPLLPLLATSAVLLSAALITDASPVPQTSEGVSRAVGKFSQKTKPVVVPATSDDKKQGEDVGDLAKDDDGKVTPAETTERNSVVTSAPKSTPTTTTKSASKATTRPRDRPTRRPVFASLNREVTTKPPSKASATTEATTTTKPTASATPTSARPTTTERPTTTVAPGFTADEVVPAQVCAFILESPLKSRKFMRTTLHGSTTCRCQSSRKAGCLHTTLYPTVRPGSPSAVHALEQSDLSSSGSASVLAANIWAMRQSCEYRAINGAVCHFGLTDNQPICDCSVETVDLSSGFAF